MAGMQDGDVPVRQDVSHGGDEHAAEGDLQAPPVRVSESRGVQIGQGSTQVNNFFVLERPAARAAIAGWPLAEANDPFALEVHRPLNLDGQQPGLPELPAYVSRRHDQMLAKVVEAGARGRSGIAVLVGGSSTGKTRACWEALRPLRDRPEPWRLWHPIDPSRPEAALRKLGSIVSHTVVWLNEAQFYLGVDGLGERVAAGLRELLRDPARAPVLMLATLWPQYWDALTARPEGGPDVHAQARELLTARDISVPAAFTADQIRQLPGLGDPRLASAAKAAEDGQVIQFLAGVPELMARYRNAPPTAAAVISAAIDARRLGMSIALPLDFLEEAAPGYISGVEWDRLGEDWLEQALAYAAAPCNGIYGPVTRIRPRRSVDPARGPTYRLADYLEQHGRLARRGIPPGDFWKAAARAANPGDLSALARFAESFGLLRDAARLRKYAAARGNADEAAILVQGWHALRPGTADRNPARWAAARASLDDPASVARLLGVLREAGAEQEAVTVLARNPATTVAVHDPAAVARLLRVMREAGTEQQVAELSARAAANAALDDPGGVARLLDVLREGGAEQQAATLLARDPAACTDLKNAYDVALLLGALQKAGAEQQVADLAARAAAHVSLEYQGGVLGKPFNVVALLGVMRGAGAEQQAAELAVRAAKHAAMSGMADVAVLARALTGRGAVQQAAELAARAAAYGALDDPGGVAALLDELREAGAEQQVAALLARDPAANVALDSFGVGALLDALRRAGAEQQVAALLARDPAINASLDDWIGLPLLMSALQRAGAEEQVAALSARAAAHARIDNPRDAVDLLKALRGAGAEQAVEVLLARDPAASASLNTGYHVAELLVALHEAGAEEQVAALASRAAAHARIDVPRGADSIPPGAALLLRALRKVGADQQAQTLVARMPAEGKFDVFREQSEHQVRYQFGREIDGSPALPWGWDDLE